MEWERLMINAELRRVGTENANLDDATQSLRDGYAGTQVMRQAAPEDTANGKDGEAMGDSRQGEQGTVKDA